MRYPLQVVLRKCLLLTDCEQAGIGEAEGVASLARKLLLSVGDL